LTAERSAWPFAPYRGAAIRRVVCMSSTALNRGGRPIQGFAFPTEGVLRKDRHQIQN
jgi:hypothetical protein